MTRLSLAELARAVELSGPLWVERNYPFLTLEEQSEYYLESGKSLCATVQGFAGQWTHEQIAYAENARRQGGHLPEAVLQRVEAA